jgi:hypothetical protein
LPVVLATATAGSRRDDDEKGMRMERKPPRELTPVERMFAAEAARMELLNLFLNTPLAIDASAAALLLRRIGYGGKTTMLRSRMV